MTTKNLTRCYRFAAVDFEPDHRVLVWKDKSETPLTIHESRLLELLCYCAGQVISAESLYEKTFILLDPYEDGSHNHYDLNTVFKSLTRKLEHNGKMAIPIEVVQHYGFRTPLPDKTCRLIHEDKEKTTQLPPPQEEHIDTATEHIVKHSLVHKVSVFILALAGLMLIFASNY
ncbi:winged helix-turn-helix domain-containing protein [Photobacterium nomapromontoriensis]|uniref:winged helix-turn-helix domain-containing protein n=1 Tax=Photobacterium nomapromontoriensis TaxID=2910237 RepID=UPI003D0C80B8